MIENTSSIITLKNHPFFVGVVDNKTKKKIPTEIDFELGVDRMLSIPRLLLNDEIITALNNAYLIGTMISTPLGESDLATDRMNEFIEVIQKCLDNKIMGKKFLEIGCGNGCLLNEIHEKGGIVTGVEIGPQAMSAKEKYALEVINKPIEEFTTEVKFDCIFSYGCLEHIINIESFFNSCRNILKDGGLFIHNVPNIDLSLKNGLIDQLQHEHINYFNPENAMPLLQCQGFIKSDYQLTTAQNEIIIWGYYDSKKILSWPSFRYQDEKEKIKKFKRLIDTKTRIIVESINRIIKKKKTIGFYAGGFEYAEILNTKDIRYFDGDDFKVGKSWILNKPIIESKRNLIKDPVDYLIIFKSHYFEAIKNTLVKLGVSENSIIDINIIEKSL